jgi:hypothetical protein
MNKFVISESERREILAKHTSIDVPEICIIREAMTPDERYIILFDTLIDVHEQKSYGNVWENSSNIILFTKHLYECSNLPEVIKEDVSQRLGKMLLTESRQDLRLSLPDIKYLMENEFILLEQTYNPFSGDFWSKDNASKIATKVVDTAKDVGKKVVKFGVDTAKATAKGIVDTAVSIGKGLYKIGEAIVTGDVLELINLLKKGVLWVARKVRQALYSTVGMIVDAILIATGVGKGVQFVVWAIVVALDIYELASGDYEDPKEPMWMRILFFGVDILAMCTAAAAALPFRAMLLGLKGVSEAGMIAKAGKGSLLRSFLESCRGVISSAASKMSSAVSVLKGSWVCKGLGGWVGDLVGKLGSWLGRLGESIAKFLGGGKAAATSTKAGSEVATTTVKAGSEVATTTAKSGSDTLTTAQKFSAGTKAGVKTAGLIGGIHVGMDYYGEHKAKEAEKQAKAEEEKMKKEAEKLTQVTADNVEVMTGGNVQADYGDYI